MIDSPAPIFLSKVTTVTGAALLKNILKVHIFVKLKSKLFFQSRVIGNQSGLRPVLESIFHRMLTCQEKGLSLEALKALKEVTHHFFFFFFF